MKMVSVCRSLAVCLMVSGGSIAAETTSRGTVQTHDPITGNFGARVAPYEGFLELSKAAFPPEYTEKSHHYTKREYLLSLERIIDGKRYSFEITESDAAMFVEPKAPPVKEFVYQGCPGRIYAYREHIKQEPMLVLYWMNAPKQRLAISVAQVPSEEWSPDDLIRLLEAMTLAKCEPVLINP